MSSFDYTDNFSGFNDLINRADFLTEMADSAKKAIAQLAKTKDGKVGLNDLIKMYQHKTKGTSPAASYAKNMLWLVAMAEQDFITDEQKEVIKRTTNMGSSTAFAKAVQEIAPEAVEALYGEEQKSEDLIKFVGDNSIILLRRAIMNMPGDNFIYVGPDVEDKELDAAVSSQKVEDDIEDVADELEQSTADTFETFKAAKEDPTTMVEIRIEDPSKVEVVKDMVKKYANEHLDVEGNSITFSADPDSPFVKAIEKYGEETIRRAFIGDLTKGSGSRVGVAIMAPGVGFDEDYEQIDDEEYEGPSMANNPGGAPSSYAQGEEGGGLTTPEDAEDELDHFLTKEQPEDKIPADYEDVLAALVDDDKKKHAIKRLYGDDDDPGHIDDMRAEYPPDPFGGGYEDEEGVDPGIENQHLLHHSERAALRRGAQLPELPVVNNIDEAINTLTSARSRFGGPEGSAVTGENNAVKWVTRVLMYNNIEVPDAATIKSRLPGSSTNLIRRSLEVDEEDFNYSPMLDSYKTSTAGYLTEQAASDKRNKKTEVKPQSFKEKYKPKTHWQLEELRRYGL